MKKDNKFYYEAPLTEEIVFVNTSVFCDSITYLSGGNEDFTEIDSYIW